MLSKLSQNTPITDNSQISKLVKEFNFLITNIADFGLLGLGTDYISHLHSLKEQLSDLGVESISKPIEDFTQGYNTKDYRLMAENLFYLSNWTTLYSKKLQILNLKLDLKDASILDKSKESIELVDEIDITFVPLTLVIEKVQENKTYFELTLRWLGISFQPNNPTNVTITSFIDEAFTKSQYEGLFFVQDRLKSKFFVNQVIQYSNLINAPIQFRKIGINYKENEQIKSLELQYTVNTIPSFSGLLAKDQLNSLLENSPFHYLILNRNCIIEIQEQERSLKITKDSITYYLHCENFYLMIQLFILYFTGISIELMILDCKHYHQYRAKEYLNCSNNSDQNSFHILTMIQGGENIVIGLQQFNIRLNYNFIFDKLLLKYSKNIDSIETVAEYFSYLMNSQIPRKHPKISTSLTEIDLFLNKLFSNNKTFLKFLANPTELTIFSLVIEFLENSQKKELTKKLINYIIHLEKKDLSIEQFKKLLVVLAFLVKIAREHVYMNDEEAIQIQKFVLMFRMKVSSREALIVQIIKTNDINIMQKHIEKFMRIILKQLESFEQLSEEIKESIIIAKSIFNRSLNLTAFDKKMLELRILWRILQEKSPLIDPIFFYYLNKY